MANNLKALVVAVAIGGSCIGVPVTLKYTSTSKAIQASPAAQPQIKTIEKTLGSEATRTTSNNGKCDVEELTQKHKDFLLSQEQKNGFYVEVSCTETNENDGPGAITTHGWTGLFPAKLLKNGENLLINEKIDIKTRDTTVEENTKTTFMGKGMKEIITGIWETKSLVSGDQSITSVSFPKNPEIKNKLYLIFH